MEERIDDVSDDGSSTDTDNDWIPTYPLIRVTLNPDTRNGDSRYTVVENVEGRHRCCVVVLLCCCVVVLLCCCVVVLLCICVVVLLCCCVFVLFVMLLCICVVVLLCCCVVYVCVYVAGRHRYRLMFFHLPRNHGVDVVLEPTGRVINIRISQITRLSVPL